MFHLIYEFFQWLVACCFCLCVYTDNDENTTRRIAPVNTELKIKPKVTIAEPKTVAQTRLEYVIEKLNEDSEASIRRIMHPTKFSSSIAVV
jgi:hypothetical protein